MGGKLHSLLPNLVGATVVATGELLDEIVADADKPRIPTDSERFSLAPRTARPLRARLRVRETHRTGGRDPCRA